jgi:hypothetical protein
MRSKQYFQIICMDLFRSRQLLGSTIIGFISLLVFFPLKDILSHDLIYIPYDLIVYKAIILLSIVYLLVRFNRTGRVVLPDLLFFLFLAYLEVSNLLSDAPMDGYVNLHPYLVGVFYCIIRFMLRDRYLVYFFTISTCVLAVFCGFIFFKISVTPFDQSKHTVPCQQL